jgi:hypothetical protein
MTQANPISAHETTTKRLKTQPPTKPVTPSCDDVIEQCARIAEADAWAQKSAAPWHIAARIRALKLR